MEPITSAAAAKVVGKAAHEMDTTSRNLLSRMLGPAADEIGMALARWTSFRVGNAERILEGADRKSGAKTGAIPPRIAGPILDQGSWIDDPLTTDYLSGVLAGSRSATGRDDRGAVWASTVAGMSSLGVRAHFLLYRAWAEGLPVRLEDDMWTRFLECRIDVEQMDFVRSLIGDSGVPIAPALSHALDGLQRRGLIEGVAWGPRNHVKYPNLAFDSVVCARVTPSGMELFGWSLGEPGVTPTEFMSRTSGGPWPQNFPRLTAFAFPLLEKSE